MFMKVNKNYLRKPLPVVMTKFSQHELL